MKKTVCDRCGKEFTGYPFSNMVLPYYEIKRCDIFVRDVDLCKDCQRDFKKWLINGREEVPDGRENTDSVPVSGRDGS